MINISKSFVIVMIAAVIASCGSDQGKQNFRAMNPNLHEVKLKAIEQTESYTYLHFQEEGDTYWAAISRSEMMEVGNTYYFDNFMEMKDFTSKELGKTFPSIYFIEYLSETPFPAAAALQENQGHTGTARVGNHEVEVMEPAVGGLSVAQVYSGKETLNGTMVRVRGEVVKFTPGVMNKNWVHIQDGTIHGGDFDLTITTDGMLQVGDIVTMEGVVTLDKDFGYGYAYEILIEDAVVIENEGRTL